LTFIKLFGDISVVNLLFYVSNFPSE